MANQTKKLFSSVAAGATDTWDSPIVAVGKRLHIKRILVSDITLNDTKSTEYMVRWGKAGDWEEVFYCGISGNVFQFEAEQEFIGDGTKYLSVSRKNNSGTAKRCPIWIEASLS